MCSKKILAMSLHVEVPLSNAAEICKYVTVKSHRFRSPPHAFHSRTNKKILLISKQVICTELKPDLGLGYFCHLVIYYLRSDYALGNMKFA